MFWYTASAVPRYQCSSTRCWGGKTSMPSPRSGRRKDQPRRKWRSREADLYWGRTQIRHKSELTQLERVKSMSRYWPPKGTAPLVRSRVSG